MATTKTLNEDQKAALKSIKRFLDHLATDTFVLKGCAGTDRAEEKFTYYKQLSVLNSGG